jgi:hypothetical protein
VSIETVAGTIQIIIAPVVKITACAILLGGMQAQFAAINDRLRAMARERLELLRTADGGLSNVASLVGAYAIERLREIDAQMPRLLRRQRLVHNAVLTLYCAMLVFVLTMFIIAVAAAQRSSGMATLALVASLVGIATVLVGVAVMAVEIRRSNDALQHETQRVLELGK